MNEKRMLIVPSELVKKIDDNRGDMSQAEFIGFLIDGQLKEETKGQDYVTKEEIRSFEQDMKKLLVDSQLKEETKEQKYVDKEEFRSFEQDMKKLFKSFLDFFVGYGLELGKQSPKAELDELSSKLEELENNLPSGNKDKEARIKWK